MIIGISGKLNSGKDTVGEIVQIISASPHFTDEAVLRFIGRQHLNSIWEIKKFADKLKDIVCMLLGCTREQLEDREFKEKELGEEWHKYQHENGQWYCTIEHYNSLTKNRQAYWSLIKLTPRLLLQLLGTECGRKIIHPNIWCNSLMSEYRGDLEEWKPIEGYEDSYYISNFGNVKSLDRTITYGEEKGNYHTKKGQILKPTLSGGYLTVSLSGRTYSVHTLVAMHFVENEKDNYVVNHIDYNKSNNFYKNLEWVTQGDNIKHNKTTLRGNFGESQKDAKLDVDKVIAIKKLLEEGTLSQNRIAKLFEVSPTTITDIKKGRKWNHVGKEIPTISPITPKLLPNWIITDMRFPNELKAVEDKGGITIRVNRPCNICGGSGYHKMSCPVSKSGEHCSETALDNAEFDYVIQNDGTLLELIAKVRQILIEQKILKNE